MKRLLCYAGVVSLAGAALSMAGPLASAASTSPAMVYVSPVGVAGATGWSCGTAALCPMTLGSPWPTTPLGWLLCLRW